VWSRSTAFGSSVTYRKPLADARGSVDEALCMSFTPGDSRSMADMNRMPLEELAALRRGQAAKGAAIIGVRMTFLDQYNSGLRLGHDY
jgi:LmbE family N-acetylglucosaminyl deacetylase